MRTIVEYHGLQPGHRCGYCKSAGGNVTHGLWAHALTPLDYNAMLDRGWRRSGCYCYKPVMEDTCCPHYTIRCEAAAFRPSRSQKRVAAAVRRYLLTDERPGRCRAAAGSTSPAGGGAPTGRDRGRARSGNAAAATSPIASAPPADTSGGQPAAKKDRSGKAKEKRRRRAIERWRAKGLDPGAQMALKRAKAKNKPKSLEDRLKLPEGAEPKHKLELRLVSYDESRAPHSRFAQSAVRSHAVYWQYQTRVHGDAAAKPSRRQFERFLCSSPFALAELEDESDAMPEYGAFHQQYLIDGEIVAVGVIDILPRCVSSKYLFYDPDYAFLSLGTYSALTEIALTRRLHERHAELAWYYMGYYIHSCPKMTYKAKFGPASLLCPETYTWQPYELCRPKLDRAKYSRLDDSQDADDTRRRRDDADATAALVLHRRTAMPYEVYAQLKAAGVSEAERRDIDEYARLIGAGVAGRALLYRQ